MNTYKCPVCQGEMHESVNQHPSHPSLPPEMALGITLWCPSRACPAQEVMGHGKNGKEAWEVIQQKYVERGERK
jgi:hypothetical protein